jgi:prevent-host-death family protein
MTMKNESNKIIPAGKFKAQCLALLDKVSETGESIVITKRGKPVARVVPIQQENKVSLLGSVRVRGDVVGPILDQWDFDR